MNKIALNLLISTLSCSSLVFAGGMGDQSSASGCCSVFASLEGGYTVNSINNYSFTLSGLDAGFSSIKNTQHYAGRLAAGMLNMLDDLWGASGEIGWGYYGRTTLNPEFLGFGDLSFKNTISGFDILAGINFYQPCYSIFFKAGALIQNVHNQLNADFTDLTDPLFPTFDSLRFSSNQTAALPEIKVGASYIFDSNWSIIASYALAVGSTQRTRGDFNVITSRATFDSNTQNPTLNTAFLGIQFTS